jgi:DNA-binding GntR family transcriptional regulator
VTDVLMARSLTDTLSEALRTQIITGEVPPGLKLTEAWVAARFDVARPTAKAGLDRLAAEGLLRGGARRSGVVPRLAEADVIDIYFSREPVESAAVSALAATGVVPPEAEGALMQMSQAATRHAHQDHTTADIAFHRALVAAAASPRLQRMHQTVMGEAELCIAQVRSNASVDLGALTQAHAAILIAIREGDPTAAADALRSDLHSCRDMLLADIRGRAAG